jgi:hypothetical protein
MPIPSASDYTAYIKMKAANLAYSTPYTRIPISNQTVAQPVPTTSILNSRIFASQMGLAVNPGQSSLSSTLGRVRPLPPNNVNRKTNFATVSTSGQVQNRYVPGSAQRT